MDEHLLDIKGNDVKFFRLLDEYREAKALEIHTDFTKKKCNVTDLINLITRLESEILTYNHMIESGEKDVDSYILSDVIGGIMDSESPSFNKYVFGN